MLRPQPHVARLVLAFVVVAERITTRLGRPFVEPHLREYPAHRLDPHRRGALALVLHGRVYIEPASRRWSSYFLPVMLFSFTPSCGRTQIAFS
jgi:hypothetical protein